MVSIDRNSTCSFTGQSAAPIPEDFSELKAFLDRIGTNRAVKEGVDAGIGLVKKRDEVVLHHSLGFRVQILLPVRRIQLITNRAHGGMLPLFQDSTRLDEITVTSRRASNRPLRAVCFEFFRLAQHQKDSMAQRGFILRLRG